MTQGRLAFAQSNPYLQELRRRLRAAVEHDADLMELLGFRVQRKSRRAHGRNNNLWEPTADDVKLAQEWHRAGTPDHIIEQAFNARGIKMTRNLISRAAGARP